MLNQGVVQMYLVLKARRRKIFTGSDIMTSGDCGALDALIQPLCPEDTGDTGA